MVERHAVVPDVTQRNAIGHHPHVLPLISEFRRAPVSMWSRGKGKWEGEKAVSTPPYTHLDQSGGPMGYGGESWQEDDDNGGWLFSLLSPTLLNHFLFCFS